MKTLLLKLLAVLVVTLLPLKGFAQVNSGSDGHDGALNPTANLVINMADHPDGIYHYTSVSIPAGVTVTFTPNANNKPVVWLVQGNCTIQGTVSVSGQGSPTIGIGGNGGPGGFRGSNGGQTTSSGLGPGGGVAGVPGGNGSFGTVGQTNSNTAAGSIYGNSFLLPLLGGSGGGGSTTFSSPPGGYSGAGGGGGAILIAASGTISVTGSISSQGGNGGTYAGSGSGGSIRLLATTVAGTGSLVTDGGITGPFSARAGSGRVRIDAVDITHSGSVSGVFSKGFQPIILPAAGQGVQLAIASIAGNAVPGNPSGVQASPDVIIPAQQTNPIPIVVNCTNIPLNTSVTVVIHPVSGADVQAVGVNNAGTTAASTATISVNMPRGGGVIYAKAVTGIAGSASVSSPDAKTRSIADTGWTADGERFAKMEITAALGSEQQITYITESGKRYALAAR